VSAGEAPLLQAVDAEGRALWTGRNSRRAEARGAALPLVAEDVDFARDVKPVLDQHCAGCHADSLLAFARPFDARRSALVVQTHAPIREQERRQLALWVDLGAAGRP
jgi:hypothetical protein